MIKESSLERLPRILALSFALLGSNCGNSSAGVSAACVPYDTQLCYGPGACRGGQTCNADGAGWTACDCGLSPTEDAGPSQLGGCSEDSKATTNTCVDNTAIPMASSKYWINNNVWGRPANDSTSRQCSWFSCFMGETLSWGTSWTWNGGYSVKSYPSVVLGWHWGVMVANTGLPVQLTEHRTINTGWDFMVNQTDAGPFSLDVAYDLWIHTISNPDSSSTGANQPSDEVMIWLYNLNTRPAGSLVAQAISLGGTTWDLWEGPTQDWTIHSFVRTANTNSSTLNIGDFLNYLVTERALDETKYLTSVQAGIEVLKGSGEVNTSSYYCDVH
jgi:hypothetical protein